MSSHCKSSPALLLSTVHQQTYWYCSLRNAHKLGCQHRQLILSTCVQDPTRRPTAQGLLQHDFLQHAQAPASLQHTISAHAAKRPPLDQHSHQVADYQQTMPRWNFGTEQGLPEAQHQQAHQQEAHNQAKKAGSLRSHQINMTFRDDGTVRHHTVAKHPSLAMMAQLAEAGLVSCLPSTLPTIMHLCPTPMPLSCISLCQQMRLSVFQHMSNICASTSKYFFSMSQLQQPCIKYMNCNISVCSSAKTGVTLQKSDRQQSCAVLQAMNGSRSAELVATDVILDSDTSEPLPEPAPAPAPASSINGPVAHVDTAFDHQAMPGNISDEPQLEHADLQALSDQARLHPGTQLFSEQARLSSDGAHHRPAASWQQSEASMQEVASTSGSSSESGRHGLCWKFLPMNTRYSTRCRACSAHQLQQLLVLKTAMTLTSSMHAVCYVALFGAAPTPLYEPCAPQSGM